MRGDKMLKKLLIIISAFIILCCAGCEAAPSQSPAPTVPVETPEPTPTPEPTADPEEIARLEREEIARLRILQDTEPDFLTLVNKWNPLPDGFEPNYYDYGNDMIVDVRIFDSLRQMLLDCEEAGCDPLVCSSYRSYYDQYMLVENKYYRLILEGVAQENAMEVALQSVAAPGTSEHQLGLAVDICSFSYTELDEGQEDTPTQKWLMENSWKYGFILRYPNGTTDLTGIIYEPWHYRYVGNIAAKEIYERGISLEEYLMMLYP